MALVKTNPAGQCRCDVIYCLCIVKVNNIIIINIIWEGGTCEIVNKLLSSLLNGLNQTSLALSRPSHSLHLSTEM